MKKISALIFAFAVMLCLSVTAFAAPGAFLESPSANLGPSLHSYENEDGDCTANVIVTPYSKRGSLPTDVKDKLEAAYEDIVESTDLANLSEELKNLAKEKGIDSAALAVSDLFDISYSDCVVHDEHGYFDVVLKADTLSRFTALLSKGDNGWELIDNAEVAIIDGQYYLRFSIDTFTPLAIVVDTSAEAPDTGDVNMTWVYVSAMVISLAAIVVLVRKSRKQEA